MKKKSLGRIVVLAFALCLISVSLMSGTLAKYTSEVTGTGTATVAKWSFKANGQAAAMTPAVKLTDTTLNSKVATGTIAPGTDGQLQVELDASGSEVAIGYSVEISDVQNKPVNLKFYSDAALTSELAAQNGKYIINGNIALNDVGTKITVPIYWKWAYETTGGDSTDTADADKDMTFAIKIIGTQQDPSQNPS